MKYSEKVKQILENTEAPEVIITDGVTLNTDNSFEINKNWIEEKLKLFNTKYFNNELDIGNLPIKVYPYKEELGAINQNSRCIKETGEITIPRIRRLEISNYYSHSEYDYANIILHEMIHLYQLQVLKHLDSVDGEINYHGETFINKMQEINSKGWTIGITETEEQFANRGEINAMIKKKLEDLNNPDKYQILFYVPRGSSTDEKVLFNIILKSEWEDGVKDITTYFIKDYLVFITTSLDKEGLLIEMLKSGDFFSKGRRISKQTFLNRDGEERKNYILSKTMDLDPDSFMFMYKLKNFSMKNLQEYINTNSLRFLEAKKKKPLTLEEIKQKYEADPNVTVTNMIDHGDYVTVYSRVV